MERITDIRHFIEGGINLDIDERLLKENQYRECWESIVNISAESNIGCLENIKGTVNVFDLAINSGFTLPIGSFKCIGAKEDTEANAIIYFLADVPVVSTGAATPNHCIMRMFIDNYRCEWVLKSEGILNFQPDHKITSIWRIGDLLGWTDNYEGTPFVDYNPPRKINIVKALGYTNPYSATKLYKTGEYAGYGGKVYKYIYSTTSTAGILPTNTTYWELANVGIYTSITQQILDRIKYPPVYAPTATFGTDDLYKDSCRLRGRMFQFAYCYVYDDNEKSVFSPISDIPIAYNQFVDGSYLDDNLSNNVIKIIINTGVEEVVAIELFVRVGNDGLWQKFYKIEKYDEDGVSLVASSIPYTYNFYNNTVLEAVNEEDAQMLFHAVPQISAHEKLIEKNRLVDGNYIEGFDNVDVDLDITPFSYGGGVLSQETSYAYEYPKYYILSYTNDDGVIEYSDEFLCIVIDVTTLTLFRDNGFWGLSILEPNNISNLIQASYIVRKGDFYQNMLISFCDQISDEQYSNYPVFCRNHIPYPWDSIYNTDGNSIGLGKIPYGKIAFAIHKTSEPGFLGVGMIYAKLFASGGISGSSTFKSRSWYELGVRYFDRAGRCGMTNSNETTRIYIPPQKDLSSAVLQGILLKLDINHIPPMFAETYEVMCTKRLSISYFNYFRINSIGKATYSTNVYGVDMNTLSITINDDIEDMHEFFPKSLVTPYIFEKGDRLRFVYYDDETSGFYSFNYFPEELDFEIISSGYPTGVAGDDGYQKDTSSATDFILDENGNKVRNNYSLHIIIPNFNTTSYAVLNNFSNINVDSEGKVKNRVFIEIYRPSPESQKKVFYGCSGKLPILNPHTSTRYHSGGTSFSTLEWNRNQTSSLSARLVLTNGDVWGTIRFTGKLGLTQPFPIECESFSDFYNSDSYNQGRVNLSVKDYRRTRYISNLLPGGMYIENTLTNDLSKVRSSDHIALAEKYGEINLIEEVGYTLKVLQKYKPTSLYIGREGLKQANIGGQDVVASKDAVLSTPIVSETDYGTTLTGGCVKYLRNIYFPDLYNGAIVRDSPNGIFPISDYGIKNFIRQKFQTYISHGIDNITAYSTYDEKYNLVFFSFIDAVSASDSFTIAFHEPTNKWISFYSFIPDYYGCLGSVLTSFKGTNLWLHDEGTRMNYYGVQYEQVVKVVSNKDPLKVKAFKSIAIDSNKAWNAGQTGDILIPANGSLTRGGSSKLPEGWFELREGKYYSNFGRNMLSSGSTASNDDLINGDELRGSSMSINLRNSSTDETKLFGVIIDSAYSPKSGG